MHPTKGEYCNSSNREAIALTAPTLLEFYDAYCNERVDIRPVDHRDSPSEDISKEDPVIRRPDPPKPTDPPKPSDNEFFYVWLIAAILVLVIVAVALFIL
jgi:hypothetical protein